MKNDTPETWSLVSDPSKVTNVFVPLLGEPFLYREPDGDGWRFSMKVGDGVRTPAELPNFDILLDYDQIAFDTSEIVIGATSTTSVLGQAILGQMVLA
jgi:hypothetical protein